MIFDAIVQTGPRDFDFFEFEAKSFPDAYILAGKVARSPIVVKIQERPE
jgi:hypothetical protein